MWARLRRHAAAGEADLAAAIQAAVKCHQLGMFADAERRYAAILAINPGHFDALHLLGLLRHQQGQGVEALRLIAAALKINARSTDAWSNQAAVLEALARPAEAVESCERALALMPDHVAALSNRANALGKLGRWAEALASCEHALACNPNHADALSNRGNALVALERPAEALASYERALALQPALCDALIGRGMALNLLDRNAEAVASYDAALARDARVPSTWNNRGFALYELGRVEEALASYRAALALDPDYVKALVNCANALTALDRHDEAAGCYDRAIACDPHCAEAYWGKSLLHLNRGDFGAGFALYDHRFTGGVKGAAPRSYPAPLWSGERVEGTLLVWGEQGLGDQILHASMVPDLADRAGSVVLEVESRLVPLFARSWPAMQVVGLGPELYAGRVDAHTPIGGLGRYLRPTLAAFPRRPQGYLVDDRARAAHLRAQLAADGCRVIGLSWRSIAARIGKSKSAELADFAALMQLPHCRFVDLQYGDTRAERAAIRRELGVCVEHLDDIDTTNDIDGLAALIAACDAVVTVSNTTAHLAGALGKPTCVLVPFGHARIWYWLKGRPDSPWYPHLRLWRQARAQPWADLIAMVTPELSRSWCSPAMVALEAGHGGTDRVASRRMETIG
jgi:tetratricopeptide (TPR) repeat protein